MTPAGQKIRKLLVIAALLFPLGIGLVLTGASLGALLVPLCSDGKADSTPELVRRCAQPSWWLGAGAFSASASGLCVIAAIVLRLRHRRGP